MDKIENIKKDYNRRLQREYEFWKDVHERHLRGEEAATIGESKMNYYKQSIDNFDESFLNFVKFELKNIALAIRNSSNTLNQDSGLYPRSIQRDDGAYSIFGFTPDDEIYRQFANKCIGKTDAELDDLVNDYAIQLVSSEKENDINRMFEADEKTDEFLSPKSM